MNCTYWQNCGIIGGGCCHHPESPWNLPSVGICTKVCKIRVEGEPMAPAPPAPPKQFGTAHSEFPNSTAVYSPGAGPGTELKKLLATIGITESSCNCQSHIAQMNREGPDWCYDNLDLIVGWLRTEAAKRSVPFIPLAARLLVLRAIALARHQPYDPPPAPPA